MFVDTGERSYSGLEAFSLHVPRDIYGEFRVVNAIHHAIRDVGEFETLCLRFSRARRSPPRVRVFEPRADDSLPELASRPIVAIGKNFLVHSKGRAAYHYYE